jgi:hypothetical protein
MSFPPGVLVFVAAEPQAFLASREEKKREKVRGLWRP